MLKEKTSGDLILLAQTKIDAKTDAGNCVTAVLRS
jgi:hypothetical protein